MKVVKVTELRSLDVIDVLGVPQQVLHWLREDDLIRVNFVVPSELGCLDVMLYQEDEFVALLSRRWPPGRNESSMLRRVVSLAERVQPFSVDHPGCSVDTAAVVPKVIKLREACEAYLLGLPCERGGA